MATETKANSSGPDIKALGFNSPMEVIDLLSILRINGQPVIIDDKSLLDPKTKAQAVIEYFNKHYKIQPKDLPYLASLIKHDLKHGKLSWRR